VELFSKDSHVWTSVAVLCYLNPIPVARFIHSCLAEMHALLSIEDILNLGVCIVLRVLDQAEGLPSNATRFQ
jgi:hypothetical protein